MMFEEVERLWHKHFNGASKVEALSWPSVELPGNGIEFRLRETGKVGARGDQWPLTGSETSLTAFRRRI